MVRRLIPLIALLAVLIPQPAQAYCINDTVIGNYQGRAFIVLPLNFSMPRRMSPVFGTLYNTDVGWNFQTTSGGYALKQVTIKQISVTPGLTGGSYFGGSNPGVLTLTDQSPHLHLNWNVTAPGTYFFEFQLINAIDAAGNPLDDSPLMLFVFIAGRDYAQVDLKTAKRLPDTSPVEVEGLTASCTYDQFWPAIYAQSGRQAGIRIETWEYPQAGDTLSVTGTMQTVGGERSIMADNCQITESATAPQPVFMSLRSLGGSGELLHTPAVEAGVGLRNTGMLVRVAGTIHYDLTGEAYIDDGSNIHHSSGIRGVRIALEDLQWDNYIELPQEGARVSITGISGAEDDGTGKIRAVIRPRSQEDVREY